MALTDIIRTTYTDLNDKSAEALVRFEHVADPADILLLPLYLTTLSDANLSKQTWELDFPDPTPGTGGAGSYPTVRDCARFYFLDTVGSVVTVTVLAPKVAIFLPDNETIDPADPDVADFITYALGTFVSPAGLALASYSRGVRGTMPS